MNSLSCLAILLSSAAVHRQPTEGASETTEHRTLPLSGLVFLPPQRRFAFITLASFFILNLYIGVVFYQYQRLKLISETGSAVLTASQTVRQQASRGSGGSASGGGGSASGRPPPALHPPPLFSSRRATWRCCAPSSV